MKTALSALEVVRPRHLAHALQMLHESLGDAPLVPLAGGTDLFVYLHAGTLTAKRFLDLSPLRELHGVRASRSGLRIGAMTTFDAIARHPACAGWPLLPQAARVVGAAQIQNRATLGGNVANASPAGDSLPVLLAYDATVHVASVRGERALPFAALYTGYRRLALEPDELIVAISMPQRPPGMHERFRKVGTRAAQSISKVVFAGVLHAWRGGIDVVRLAWGSVAPTPVRAKAAEHALLGRAASPDVAAEALDALGRDIAPIDDIRSDSEYRMDVSRALLAQFLATALPSLRGR